MIADFLKYQRYRAMQAIRCPLDRASSDQRIFGDVDWFTVEAIVPPSLAPVPIIENHWLVRRLTLEVFDKTSAMLEVSDFPLNKIHSEDEVRKHLARGISDPSVIARNMILSLADERLGIKEDIFDLPGDIEIPLWRAILLIPMFFSYIQLGSWSGVPDRYGEVTLFGEGYALRIEEECDHEDDTYEFGLRPSDQNIRLPRPVLAVMLRMCENALRYLKAGYWGKNNSLELVASSIKTFTLDAKSLRKYLGLDLEEYEEN